MNFNPDNYDLVFIGSPVWAGKPTPAINAFISKAVIFVTMAMHGGKSAVKVLRRRIESKGGKIIGSFIIRTLGVKEDKLIRERNETGNQYKIGSQYSS
ncbi:flavodoxin family protein [Staphylothermus hellenicus]|uniref:flavodoxin family protein n=1 Tax=Staphylothermus hellenicus TaxID=84599 RepID=UPI0001C461F5|nr:hypothetical protein [Staphylothermus hellenicus]